MSARPERLIISLHIPKTGGTSFGEVLERAFPGQVAYLYKAHNRRTHPLLREHGRVLEPQVLAEIEAQGFRVLHGHGAMSVYAGAVPDPGRYWTWVRDPVERVISSYFYLLARADRPAANSPTEPARDRVRGRTLEGFARTPANRNQQNRILAGAPIEAFGFVGVTEKFEESLARLELPGKLLPASRNVNRERPQVELAVRALIAEMNAEDMRLYERALRLHEAGGSH